MSNQEMKYPVFLHIKKMRDGALARDVWHSQLWKWHEKDRKKGILKMALKTIFQPILFKDFLHYWIWRTELFFREFFVRHASCILYYQEEKDEPKTGH